MSAPSSVLLVEPFMGGSHRAWAEGWATHSRHQITVLGHKGTAWRWRIRGAAATLGAEASAWVSEHGRPDVIVSTDMLDLSAFLGLTRNWSAAIPTVLYMHENQLTYPRQPGEPLDQGLAWAAWRSLLAADAIWCNSQFHLAELADALPGFLSSVPDHDHDGFLAAVIERMAVVPPGIEPIPRRARPTTATPIGRPLVVSNQRWHHDKDVGAVVRACTRAADAGLDFELAVVGDERGGDADALNPLIDALGERIVARGHQPRDDYRSLLARADVVVSAARNEFFGIAVAEAISAGAWPVLPDRLAYPDVVPPEYHSHCLYGEAGLGDRLRAVIGTVKADRSPVHGLAESMTRFAWPEVAAEADDRVDALIAAGPNPPAH